MTTNRINRHCVSFTPFACKFAAGAKYTSPRAQLCEQNPLGTAVAAITLMFLLLAGQANGAGTKKSPPPMPPGGTFYSLQNLAQPPLPFDPFPDLPLLSLGDGIYAFDDRSVNYAAFTAQASSCPPSPDGSTNCGGGTFTNPPPRIVQYGPNDLWIAITNLGDGTVQLTLNGTKNNKFYELLSKTALTNRNWKFGQIIQTFNFNQTNVVFSPIAITVPDRFWEGLAADNRVSIVANSNGVEPGPGNVPPAVNGSFTVTRTGGNSASNLTVRYKISGTASNGVDYTAITNFVTIPAGGSTATITIHPLADSIIEFEEPVVLSLIITNGYVIEPPGIAQLTINDYFATNLFTTNLLVNAPIGIDYSPTASALLASVNYVSASSGGNPYNFLKINSNGTTSQWSTVTQIPGEIKLATVKTTAHGFTQGEMYFGNGTAVGKLNANGTVASLNWATLTNGIVTNPDELRGALYVDQTGTFTNNLIAVTSSESAPFGIPSDHGVWQIESSGTPHLLTLINTLHLEGVITLTNDVAKWGPWAGKILTGDESAVDEDAANLQPLIFSIDPNGVTTAFILGIQPEDFDIIPTNQDLYISDPFGGPNSTGRIMKLSKTLLTNYVGSLLITQAGEPDPVNQPAKLFIVTWTSVKTNFDTRSITCVAPKAPSQLEHVTFAPITLPNH